MAEGSSWLIAFLAANWGNLLSLLGLALTIYYARGAKSAAEAAKRASDETQARIRAVDWVLHFSAMLAAIDSILSTISEGLDARRLYSELTELRAQAAIAAKFKGNGLDADTLEKIKLSPAQFQMLASSVNVGPKTSLTVSNTRNLEKKLSDQRELCAIALMQAKQHASGAKHAD